MIHNPDSSYCESVKDVCAFFHRLRTESLRRAPRVDGVVLSAGCSGRWYFDWFLENYGPVRRHIGLEYYSPRPADLPDGVEWIVNTVSDMNGVQDDEVDFIFSGQNIEHLWPDEVTGFLVEANRVLKPGCWIALDSPNRLVTSPLHWSHSEHVMEFTPSEIRELLQLAGFGEMRMRGIWLCYDYVHQQLLPYLPLDSPPAWPFMRRIEEASTHVDESFIWWVEARKTSGIGDQKAIHDRVRGIWSIAWPDRVQRLMTHIGKRYTAGGTEMIRCEPGEQGALVFGPYMPLRPGRYEVMLSVRAEVAQLPPHALVCVCDVHGETSKHLAVRELHACDFPGHAFVDVSFTFHLEKLEFGVQFRIFSMGTARLEAVYQVRFREL